MLESLVKCGAFDFLGRERAELFDCIDESLAAASASHKDRASGQVSLFDELLPPPAPRAFARQIIAWSEHDKMSAEKELLGFYVTGHPLDAYAGTIASGGYRSINSLAELDDRSSFRIAGSITQSEKKFTKKEGKPFGVIWIEDLTGTLEIVVWNEVYSKVGDELVPGRVIAVQGTVDRRDDTIRATAQKVKVLAPDAKRAETNGSDTVVLRFPPSATSTELQEVRQILATAPGYAAVQLLFERPNGQLLRLEAGADFRVNPSAELREKLTRWIAA
jgi:DNA polymerase-3 subunit alpha